MIFIWIVKLEISFTVLFGLNVITTVFESLFPLFVGTIIHSMPLCHIEHWAPSQVIWKWWMMIQLEKNYKSKHSIASLLYLFVGEKNIIFPYWDDHHLNHIETITMYVRKRPIDRMKTVSNILSQITAISRYFDGNKPHCMLPSMKYPRLVFHWEIEIVVYKAYFLHYTLHQLEFSQSSGHCVLNPIT